MTSINHEIKINAPIEKVFTALNSLKELRAWHTANIEGSAELNGTLIFKPKDQPTFGWKVVKVKPEKSLTWECIEGPGDSVGTEATYSLLPIDKGRVLVEFSHTKWPHDQGHFRKCNTLWGVLLHHLKNYVETGKSKTEF